MSRYPRGRQSIGFALKVSDMKNRLEVQLTPRLALLEIVDQDRRPDPCRSNFRNESLQRHELTATVDQIVDGEYPVPGAD